MPASKARASSSEIHGRAQVAPFELLLFTLLRIPEFPPATTLGLSAVFSSSVSKATHVEVTFDDKLDF